MNLFNADKPSIFSFGIDDTSGAHLQEAARWGKFVAILSMIGLGIVTGISVLYGYNGSAASARHGQPAYYDQLQLRGLVTVLIIVLVNIYPVVALYRFSTGIRRAVVHADRAELLLAVRLLRNLFRYLGIVSAVVLAFYAVLFLVTSVRSLL